MLNWELRTLPAKLQRYPSGGDYFEDASGKCIILVCEMGNWKYEALVAAHEICEYLLVKAAGIKIESIDDYDKQFEREREMGIHGLHDEPGDQPDSPYHVQHCIATGIERILAAALLINWTDYAYAVDSLCFGHAVKKAKKK